MSWKVRHEGSPRSIDNLTLPQVAEGLVEGLWEPTDEVMGPSDKRWVAIETHPQLAEVAADLEPPEPYASEDEARLDMNPLIDVALVLLIFFILTASYAALQKLLDMPELKAADPKGVIVATKNEVDTLIKVRATQENGQPVFYVENQRVSRDNLDAELAKYVRGQHKTQMLIDADDNIDWGSVVALQDAAKRAGIEHAYYKYHRPPAGK